MDRSRRDMNLLENSIVKLVILTTYCRDTNMPRILHRSGQQFVAHKLMEQAGVSSAMVVVGSQPQMVMDMLFDCAEFAYNPYHNCTGSVAGLRVAGALYDGPALVVYDHIDISANDMQQMVFGPYRVGITRSDGDGAVLIKDGEFIRVRKRADDAYAFAGVAKVANILDFIGDVSDAEPVGACAGGCKWVEIDYVCR